MLHLKSAFFESEFQAFAQYEDDRFFHILYNVSESAEIEWNVACEAIWFFNIFHQNLWSLQNHTNPFLLTRSEDKKAKAEEDEV